MTSVPIKDKDGDIVEACKPWRKYGYAYKLAITSHPPAILLLLNFFAGREQQPAGVATSVPRPT